MVVSITPPLLLDGADLASPPPNSVLDGVFVHFIVADHGPPDELVSFGVFFGLNFLRHLRLISSPLLGLFLQRCLQLQICVNFSILELLISQVFRHILRIILFSSGSLDLIQIYKLWSCTLGFRQLKSLGFGHFEIIVEFVNGKSEGVSLICW